MLAALTFFEISGCGRSRAQGLRPDLAGVWDVAYEDVIDVEVTLGGQTYRARVPGEGGTAHLHDAGSELALHVDCSRPELVCPNEALDTELQLTNRMGAIEDDGDTLVISLLGEGADTCRLSKGSLAHARIESHGSADSKSWRAVALSGGRAVSMLSAACLMPAEDTKVALQQANVKLSVGFSAVRR